MKLASRFAGQKTMKMADHASSIRPIT